MSDQPTKSPKAIDALKKFEDVAASCNRCGFCTSYCPTYLATGSEAQSPRGRNQTFRALIEGKLKNPKDALDIIDTCLLCGECTSVCFSEVPTAQLMVQARDYIHKTTGVPSELKFFLDKILPHPRRMRWLLKVAFLGKRLRISTLLRKAKLLKKFPALEAADALVREVPMRFLLERFPARQHLVRSQNEKDQLQLMKQQKEGKAVGHLQRPKIAYIPVCGSQYVKPEIGIAVFKIFKRLKVEFSIPDVACCGLPAASYGVLDSVRSMAKSNVSSLEHGGYETLVVDDSSCATHWKDYPKYFQEDATSGQRVAAASQRVREFSVFLLQRGFTEHLKRVTWNGPTVAYHDPCKAQYGQKLIDPPRELLRSINRLTLLPIPEADQCCGGGGTYSFVHPEISQAVMRRKIQNIISTGASIVVTSSTSCLIQLQFGLREAGSSIQAMHLAEFLVRVLEKSR